MNIDTTTIEAQSSLIRTQSETLERLTVEVRRLESERNQAWEDKARLARQLEAFRVTPLFGWAHRLGQWLAAKVAG